MMVEGTVCCVRASVVVVEALMRWGSRVGSENKQLLPAEGPCHWPYSSQQQVSHQVPASPSRAYIHTCAPHAHTYGGVESAKPCAHLHTHTHTHTQLSVCVWELGGDLELLTENKERNQEKMQPLRINLTTMLRKIPNLTPRNTRKTWFLSFQSSQKCLTKAEIENILDKRIQAPFWKGPHTKLCVIPTRNWFIYQKIIRFNAKALRLQIKDNTSVCVCVLNGARDKKRGEKILFSSACYFLLLCLHDTQDFAWRGSYENGVARAEQNDLRKRKENNKHVRGIWTSAMTQAFTPKLLQFNKSKRPCPGLP